MLVQKLKSLSSERALKDLLATLWRGETRSIASAAEINDMLNKKSGLLGISGLSGDMRDILVEMHRGHEKAKLTFDLYVHRLRGRRAATCKGLEFLGVTVDLNQNKESVLDRDISSPDSRARVFVIWAAEDWAIAGECWKLCRCSAVVA